jgi:nucleoside-diphosphate-sugar epimerase
MDFHEQFSGKRILVTGATGFIGNHLVQELVSSGAELYAVSRRCVDGLSSNGARWYEGDLSIIGTVQALFQEIQPDLVFHLASHVAGGRGLELVDPTLQCNLVSAVNIMAAAAGMTIPPRVLLAGSMEEPDPEIDGVPSSPYAAAKWAATAYARMFADLYQLPVSIARIFMVYGPDQPDENKLVPYVIQSLLKGETPGLSSGARFVDWIYVEDVVEGLMAMAISDNINGMQVDLGTGELYTVGEIVDKLRLIAGSDVEPDFGSLPERQREQERIADTRRTQALISWEPRVSIDEGLQRTFAWYRDRNSG